MSHWYMNFCAPFIPNDQTISFHRLIQSIILLSYTLLYIFIRLYYSFRSTEKAKIQKKLENQVIIKKRDQIQLDSASSSVQSKQLSLKLDQIQNDSAINLKKTKNTWETSDSQQQKEPNRNASQQIQQYFSIVYGHFAIIIALSIIYTPYAEQSIAALIYIILTIALLVTLSKKNKYGIRTVWILMVFVLLFITTCGVLEIGQSNWDILNLDCFSNKYDSFYN